MSINTNRFRFTICSLLSGVFFIIGGRTAPAEDWPVYNHDNYRSGVTSEHFSPPLYEQWTFVSPHKPRPAWPSPAPRDIWHRVPELKPRVAYDRAYHVVAAGERLYFGSSADDKIYALDTATGSVVWSFFTDGPVRIAPAVVGKKVYAGSDDGLVYCLDASNGSLQWKYDPVPGKRKIPGNGRIISNCPVRTGVLVEDGVAYFCAGIFPLEGVGVYALNANTGSELWKTSPDDLSPQGYLLASKTHLYVPTGRTSPAAFNREDGAFAGAFSAPHGDGGAYALITDDTLVNGPGKELVTYDARTKDQLLTFAGKRMIVSDGIFYLLSDSELAAYDRARVTEVRQQQQAARAQRRQLSDSLMVVRARQKNLSGDERSEAQKAVNELTRTMASLDVRIKQLSDSEYMWKKPVERLDSVILADDILFCGGENSVAAYDSRTGKRLWTGAVTGTACGLAAANGCLYVSTDAGTIHCFGQRKVKDVSRVSVTFDNDPFPEDPDQLMFSSIARTIVSKLDTNRGYCLVLDADEGRLMYELVQHTDMHIIGIESNIHALTKARETLDKTGLYGVRVSMLHGSTSHLPFTDCFANLIVCDRMLRTGHPPDNPDEVYRVLRPSGGLVVIGKPKDEYPPLTVKTAAAWIARSSAGSWNLVERHGLWIETRRGAIDGGGEWTHQYAEPGNTASSADELVKPPLHVQWFGRPGPQHINDRHHRPMAPLYKDGRVFTIGSDYIFASDAYNGIILWERNIPGIRRVGVIRDCGHAAAASDYLYIAAGDTCFGLHVQTGETERAFTLPVQAGKDDYHWGYIAYADDLLFGSAMKKTAPRTEHSYATIMEGAYFDDKPVVASDTIFCLDRHTGENWWVYEENGIILNSSIAVSGEYVYFIKSTSPAALSDKDGRVLLRDALLKGYVSLVKLDKRTGSTVWEQPVGFPYEHVIYLSVKDNIVLVTGTYNRENGLYYGLFGFSTTTGELMWENGYKYGDTLNGDHGEQDQHPVIIGETIYSRPCDFNLKTGEKGLFNLVRGGHGCGTISGSSFYLFGRGGYPRMYDVSEGGATNIILSKVHRPGCFINMIPAGGLVLIPESSSGCTCPYPLQTSVVYAPER